MATIGNTYPTLADLLKRSDPDNSVAAIIELLAETNPILEDALTMEGNLPTGHRTTVRTGLPTGTWRKLYSGVPVEKSTTVQVDDTTGMLESYAQVDKSLADLNGNTSAFRLSESRAFLEGMNQTFASTFIYGDTDLDPEKFMGLAPRFDTLDSGDDTVTSYNVINCDAVTSTGTDQTSMWFVTWDESVMHLIYPKGSNLGLMHEDKGQETLADSNGNLYEGYRDHFKWDVGLSVRDWRGISRLANIDTSAIGATDTDLIDNMIDCFYRIEERPGRKVIYCNRTMRTWLHKIAIRQASSQITLETFGGKTIPAFLGVPIKQVDKITNTEAILT